MAFLYFFWTTLFFVFVGSLFAWLAFSPYKRHIGAAAGCQPDNEGSWSIGVYRGNSPFNLQPIESANIRNNQTAAWPVANPVFTCASVTDMSHPSNFVAYPFLFAHGAKMYMFFETKNSITMQGDIGVAESTDQGVTWTYLGIALGEDWHVSYPYVFEYGDEIYMMPEGSQNGDLRLYRAVEFPLRWVFHKTLISKPLVGASMVKHEGEYWLFASNFHHFGNRKNGQLEIWFAPSPLGPWVEHPQNPILNGDSSIGARGGGTPFLHDGELYRIGQDCGETYGRRLRVFQVVTLTKEKYHEVEVPFNLDDSSKKGQNAWNGHRTHHMDLHQLSSGEWMAVIDGDRSPAGGVASRYILGAGALLLLLSLNVTVGILFGYVSWVIPLLLMIPGKKAEPVLPWVIRPQFPTRFFRAASRLSRSGSSLKRIRWRSCLWCLFLLASLAVTVLATCTVVNCFFGGNGAEEPYPVDNQYSQFTMIAMTYEARLWNLQMYVKHYSRCASVREIVVVWNKGTPPDLEDFDSAVPVRIRVEPQNSLNNRFKPDELIKTKAVFELDDDIMITCDDVERGFKAWREHPDRMVGYYPRLVDGTPLTYRNERYARSKKGYNMILTGAAFMDSEVAFQSYWSPEVEQARAVVDDLFNCEDILMNFILANQTAGRAVEYVHPAWAIDTSKLSSAAISRDTQGHYDKRTKCLKEFTRIFGGVPVRKWGFLSRKDGWDN